jgi:hypothetical protein
MNKPKTVSKIKLSKWFRSCVDQAAKSGDWTGYDPDCEYAIYHLINNMDKKVSKEFIRELTGAIFAEFDEDEHEGIFCCPSDIEKILIKGIAELGYKAEEEKKT